MLEAKRKSVSRVIFQTISMYLLMLIAFSFDAYAYSNTNDNQEELKTYIQQLVEMRNNVLVSGETELLETMYDTNTRFGVWALEHEIQKMNYIKNWGKKQGVKFIDIKPKVIIKKVRIDGATASAIFWCSTTYKYVYLNKVESINTSRIGTEHYIRLAKKENIWVITKEWYKDPFADSMNINTLKDEELTTFIGEQGQRDLNGINTRRKSSVEYADKYCGIAGDETSGYKYNNKYYNFNSKGGDCANFGSQILHEGGAFRKTSSWNCDRGGATRAWVNADGFKNYMVRSGRASVIAYGSYKKVCKASYKLLPGDFVAYEKKGDILHISVVTAADSRGYTLVSCHNTDRSRVPWDLGWSNSNIKFWLVRVHF